MLSFEEKIVALATVRSLGVSKAVFIMSRMKRCPAPTMREELDKLNSTHYLLDSGYVEKSDAGVVRYIDFACPQQPNAVTKEYYESCKKPKQDALLEALAVLNCSQIIGQSHRPAPLTRKVRYAKVEEVQPS